MPHKQQFNFSIMIAIIFLFCSVIRAIDIPTPGNTHEDLEKIKKYELVYFDLSSFESSNIISFDAFGRFYQVELRLNEDLNPLYLKHPNGQLSHKYNLTQFWSNLSSSCHYFATVINTDLITSGSISLCDKRGIRGTIHAFGDSISIKPAKYYFDVQHDASNYHHLHDQHLVFKQSNYENMDESSTAHRNTRREALAPQSVVPQAPNHRRLLASSHLVETASFIAPDLTSKYKSKYSGDWEDRILSELADDWNYVSNMYANAKICKSRGSSCSKGWGSSVGSIRFKWIEVEILESWPFDQPRKKVIRGRNLWEGDPLLDSWMDYLQRSKRNVDYDAAALFIEYGLAGELYDPRTQEVDWAEASGVAPLGEMCRRSSPASSITVGISSTHNHITNTHELGHNLGLEHDGQGENSCDDNDGIMGYGRAEDYWSTCTQDYMESFIRRGADCLDDEHSSQVGGGSNTGSGGGGDDRGTNPDDNNYYDYNYDDDKDRNPGDDRDTNRDDREPPSTGGGCVVIRGMSEFEYDGSTIDFNGEWNSDGDYNGQMMLKHSRDGHYLYRSRSVYDGAWVISSSSKSESEDDIWAWCERTELSSCRSEEWQIWVYKSEDWHLRTSDMKVSGSSCSGYAIARDTNAPDYASCDALSLECVSIESIVADANGDNYGDYKWKSAGCKDGHAYYTSARDDRYLCYDETRQTYVISNTLCDGDGDVFAYGGPASSDILKYAHWKVLSEDGGYIKDREVYTAECGVVDGYTYHSRKFRTCLEEGYDTCVTIYNNGYGDLLWNGSVEFNAFEQFCVNDKPIYSHVFAVDDVETADEDGEFVFYLRYLEYHADKTWVISVNDRIYDSQIHAVCHKSELSECVNDNWNVMLHLGDERALKPNPSMTIEVSTCAQTLTTKDRNQNGIYILWMGVIIVVVALVCVLIAVLWIKRTRLRANQKKHMEVVEDESEGEVDVEDNEEHITITN
eukprot:682918_1